MKQGLGVGIDLPWRGPYGIVDGQVSDRTLQFFQRHAHRFSTVFVSWQPRGKGTPTLEELTEAWDPFFEQVAIPNRTLHQTALNLAGSHYNRDAIVSLTNRITDRYQMQWVNEDLGSWSVHGRPLPYPQPPPLTAEGVAHCAQVCADVDRALHVPLVVEFPGFETPAPWIHGALDAYDAFRQIVQAAEVYCTLDTGHLLTWRWRQGHRGSALLDGLHRLPLDRCIELHCSGTAIVGEQIIDTHNGQLLDIQLELASRLMALCPNLRVVTYEDPRFGPDGSLPATAEIGLGNLEKRVESWMDQPHAPTEPISSAIETRCVQPAPWERELHDTFHGETRFGRRCRAQLLTRSARGVGTLRDLYPQSIQAWRDAHGSPDLDTLVRAFLKSDSGASWSEFAWAVPGCCIEDAFGRFVDPGGPEHLTACARVLALHPHPPFRIPTPFRRAPQGWFAVTDHTVPMLYAGLNGQLVCGAITPLLSQILNGQRPNGADEAVRMLTRMGLLAELRS